MQTRVSSPGDLACAVLFVGRRVTAHRQEATSTRQRLPRAGERRPRY